MTKAQQKKRAEKPKVKTIDFERTGRIRPEFAAANGLYDPNTGTVYIHDRLPIDLKDCRESVLHHELFHARVHKMGFDRQMTTKQEEIAAALYGLARTPQNRLPAMPKHWKRVLFSGLIWTNVSDRRHVIHRILELAGIEPNRELVVGLS